MQIIIIQTVIVLDFPDEPEEYAPKREPPRPSSLLEKLCHEAQHGRNENIWQEEEVTYGTILT